MTAILSRAHFSYYILHFLWNQIKCHKESLMQRSPKTRKFCFCVTATARPLCAHWTTNTAVVAQQVVQRRQSGGRTIAMVALVLPWSPNGGTVVDTVIAQWTLLVGQRKHSVGTMEAEASRKLIHNVYNNTHEFTGLPMADPCASILRSLRCLYLPPASFERPVSDRPARRPKNLWLFWTCSKLHGDHGVHGEVWTSSVPPLNDQGNLSASFVPSTATWSFLWSHKGGTNVAAPCVKGVWLSGLK